MIQRIAIKDAKEELVKINSYLTKPHILIGGLAANQYNLARISSDIDLVIEHATANKIIGYLYPTLTWNIIDRNDDEIRPSYEIINRANNELIIRFGPKILQRQPYDFIDWSILFKGAKKFSYQNSELDNILIPSPVNLSFTKLISYISRRQTSSDKALVDLDDFANLTNHEVWNTVDFYTIVANTNAFSYLKENLKFSRTEKAILEKSSLYHLVNIFREPTDEISKIPNPTASQKERVEKAIENGEKFIGKLETKEIGAIGIDLIGFSAINMRHGTETGDKIIKIISSLIDKAELNKHSAEIIGDTFIVYLTLDNKSDLQEYASKLHSIVNSHNWKEIQQDLYVNAYTTFGLKTDLETVREFSKRIFDSILNQKESGNVFKPAEEKISRDDWDIEQMVSHR